MKTKELRIKKKEELKNLLAEKQMKILELRFKQENKDHRVKKKLRKEIAQIMTILSEKRKNKSLKAKDGK